MVFNANLRSKIDSDHFPNFVLNDKCMEFFEKKKFKRKYSYHITSNTQMDHILIFVVRETSSVQYVN